MWGCQTNTVLRWVLRILLMHPTISFALNSLLCGHFHCGSSYELLELPSFYFVCYSIVVAWVHSKQTDHYCSSLLFIMIDMEPF